VRLYGPLRGAWDGLGWCGRIGVMYRQHNKEPLHVRAQQVSFIGLVVAAVLTVVFGTRWLGVVVMFAAVLLWMELL
jgi:hypothetical protein